MGDTKKQALPVAETPEIVELDEHLDMASDPLWIVTESSVRRLTTSTAGARHPAETHNGPIFRCHRYIEPEHCDPEQAFDVCGGRETFLRCDSAWPVNYRNLALVVE